MKTAETTTLDTVTAAEIQGIDEALGSLDLEFDATGSDAVVETISDDAIIEAAAEPEELTELDTALELDADAVSAIDAEAAKEEAYETQETTSDLADTTAPAPQPAPAKKAKASTSRQPRDLASLAAENFVLTTDEPADLEANKAAVIASAPSQKKVAEKFENLLMSVAAGRQPSVYTMDCFRVLSQKGEVTSTDLVAALRATKKKDGNTYSEGTARSQAGQIMALFPVLKIATRASQTLKINEDSVLAMALKEMIEKEQA